MSDLITIVIPVYNVKTYLDECLTSVTTQSYPDLEIIVVDDGSFDGSETICDDWSKKDPRIRVIHQANKGLSVARNVGIEAAGGRYIAFLDSDDYYESDGIKNLYECAIRNDADLVIGSGKWVSEDGRTLEKKDYSGEESLVSKEEFWCRFCDEHDYIVAWTKLYKKELFNGVRFPEGQINEDFNVARFIVEKAETIIHLNKSVYNYRIRQGSILRSPFSEKNLYLIGERLKLIDYILKQDFSTQSKYFVCRRQFPGAMDGLGCGYKYLDTKDVRIKGILDGYYRAYMTVAKTLLNGVDGSVKPDLFTKVSLRIYVLSRRLYFLLRGVKKKGL